MAAVPTDNPRANYGHAAPLVADAGGRSHAGAMPRHTVHRLRSLLGAKAAPVGHVEKIISVAGGLIGIALVYLTSMALLGPAGVPWIVSSMGSSAVLLFAVPHGAMSQPRALVGGHFVSAVIGVSAAQYIPDPILAAALAVGLSIGAMYYLNCAHAPGGATALGAVLGGPEIHSLGYQFVLSPVMLNVALILAVTIAFNYPSAWRRYPATLLRRPRRAGVEPVLGHDDFEYALRHIGSYVDVTEEDLVRIFGLATRHARVSDGLDPAASASGTTTATVNTANAGPFAGSWTNSVATTLSATR